MNRTYAAFGSVAIALVLFVIINLAGEVLFSGARIDLTEQGLYTLSEGTRTILKELKEPITLKFYFSDKEASDIPTLKNYATRVRELLQEYALVAGDKVVLEIIDPESFSEEEDQAVQDGLQGVSIAGVGQQFYFGLVGVGPIGEKQVIPFFQPDRENFLEYDLTQLVYTLAHPEKPVIGLLSSVPMSGGFSQQTFAMTEPWMILDQLKQQFDIRTLGKNLGSIGDDIDVLMVVNPTDLTESTLYAIDQFVLRGGRVLAFVDPVSEATQNPQAPPDEGADFSRLLDAWGISYNSAQVVGDLNSAQRVRVGQQGQVLDFILWMSLQKGHFSEEDIVTNQLNVINVATAGNLIQKEGATTSFTPLIETSSTATTVEQRGFFYPNPAELLRNFRSADHPFTLAARVQGPAVSAFPDGPPKAGEEAPEEDVPKEHLSSAKEDINLIVVADSDMLQDKFWVDVANFFGRRLPIPKASNADLVINAIDNLSGSGALISVRSRGDYTRPFTLIRELQGEAERRFLTKEQELQSRLQETERKINDIQRMREDAASTTLTPEQEEEVKRFREEQVRTRKELRQVQHDLRKDIESLERRLKLTTIGIVPLLVGAAGIGVGIWRRKRRRIARP